jgi:hypothetical protein
MTIKIPLLFGVELYGELGGEDEAGGFLSNKAYLAGVYLPYLEPTGRLSVRAEYADLTHQDDNSGAWYRHRIYQSGYTYRNKIMGHHVGSGAEDFYVEMELRFPHSTTITAAYNLENRGVEQPVTETHSQLSFGFSRNISPWLYLKASWKYDSVENFGYEPNRDEDFHLTELALGGRF